MKPGSLVICPNGHPQEDWGSFGVLQALPASQDIVYTVRIADRASTLDGKWDTGLRFEEVTCPTTLCYDSKYFRELHLPSVKEIIEEREFELELA